jgi:hypothetical protein
MRSVEGPRPLNFSVAAMRSRTAIHRDFVARFHFGKRGASVSQLELDEMEAELGTKLPASYRDIMTRHGAVYTPEILQEIVEKNLDHPDVQIIERPREAVKCTKVWWSAGMPDDVIGVAWDCMANTIGFRRQTTPSEDASVVLFDHDIVEVSEVAASFDEFLAWYLDHLKGHLTND